MQAPPIPYLQMDGEIFFEDSLQRLASGKLARVDLLAGVTGDEGYVFVGFVIPELNSAEPDTEKAEQQLKGYLSVLLPNSATEIQDQIMEYYFGGNMSHLTAGEIKQKAARIFGVLTMTAPTFLHAQHQSGRCTLSFTLTTMLSSQLYFTITNGTDACNVIFLTCRSC